MTRPARSHATTPWPRLLRAPRGAMPLAVDDSFDDDPVEYRKREDREHRAEVQSAEGRDQAPEDAQERFADVAQEREHLVERARVGQAESDCEQQLDDDVQDDQQRV